MLRYYTSAIALAAATSAAADTPTVVTDIGPVQGLVAAVMEGADTPTQLLPPGANPHDYALRPSEARALQDADVVFWIGESLAPWMEDVIETLAAGATHVALSETEGATVLETRDDLLVFADGDADGHDHGEDHDEEHDHGDEDHGHDEHGHGDAHAHDKEDDHDHDDHAHDEHDHDEEHAHGEEHAHDEDNDKDEDEAHDDHGHKEAHDDHGHDHGHAHDHGGLDPHLWLDPANATLWLTAIADTLSTADPDNADLYRANAEAEAAQITTATARATETLATSQDVSFVVLHDAYQYFEEAFGLTAFAAVSPNDATAPGAGRVAELQEALSENAVSCAFAEPGVNTGTLEAILAGAGTSIVTLDPLGAEAADYPAFLDYIAGTFSGCLAAQ